MRNTTRQKKRLARAYYATIAIQDRLHFPLDNKNGLVFKFVNMDGGCRNSGTSIFKKTEGVVGFATSKQASYEYACEYIVGFRCCVLHESPRQLGWIEGHNFMVPRR